MKPKQKPGDSLVREQGATYEDYANMPDDGVRYELANGVLEAMSPAPSPKHQVVSHAIQNVLTNTCGLDYFVFASPIDLILSDNEVRQPDVVMVRRDNASIITRRGIEGVPDLVVEILSPHSARRDRHNKLRAYAKYAIPEYWIVDAANQCLDQYLLAGDQYELFTVYEREDTVQSERLLCVSFTMAAIVDAAAGLPG